MITSERNERVESRPFHAVRFYKDTPSLARIVGQFIVEGLDIGQPAIIVARPEHRQAFAAALNRLAIDVDRTVEHGDLIFLDADKALAAFMVNGMPSSAKFDATFVPTVEKLTARRPDCAIRIYGEMADVLWKDGREDAAIGLETLGSEMAKRNLLIFCGYAMGNSYKAAAFESICRTHTHVVSADGIAAEIGPGGVI
jgi:DcmR-like sensory protein